MKANELMIGDWVLNRKKFTDVKPIRLTQVDFCLWKADGTYAKDYIECDPIPLTPEILEKNGFAYNANTADYEFKISAGDGTTRVGLTCRDCGYWDLRIWVISKFMDDEDIEITISSRALKVHELQHALRLCGIKKEIEL